MKILDDSGGGSGHGVGGSGSGVAAIPELPTHMMMMSNKNAHNGGSGDPNPSDTDDSRAAAAIQRAKQQAMRMNTVGRDTGGGLESIDEDAGAGAGADPDREGVEGEYLDDDDCQQPTLGALGEGEGEGGCTGDFISFDQGDEGQRPDSDTVFDYGGQPGDERLLPVIKNSPAAESARSNMSTKSWQRVRLAFRKQHIYWLCCAVVCDSHC
jgi:hypothetical protein